MNQVEQARIRQLTSTYGPTNPPELPLGFADYLSILWRLDRSAGHDGQTRYYRHCAMALTDALGFRERELGLVLHTTAPGDVYATLSHIPYRRSERLIDAADRRAAIQQLLCLRSDILSVGAYTDEWKVGWPGSGIVDTDLRDRVYAVLFTALPGQYPTFARMLLVLDIVLQELLTGSRKSEEVSLETLVTNFGYPDPKNAEIQDLYTQVQFP